ncbi:MAG: FIST signal transduction protein [Sporichthyaceae bacterium]
MRFGSGLVRARGVGAHSPVSTDLDLEAAFAEPELPEVPLADDLSAAATQAARSALGALDGARPDLACVFVSGGDAGQVAAAGAAAVATLNATAVIGCSAHGVIGPGSGVEAEPAVAVWAAVLPGARVRSFGLEVIRSEDGISVFGLPELDDSDAVGVLLADPWTFPVDGFVELSNEMFPGLPLVGGLAGAMAGLQTPGRPPAVWLCHDGESHPGGAVGVLIGGDVGISTVVSQGCRPVGPTMVVTAAEGNELLGLAGTPAAAKLQEVLAELSPADRHLALTGLQIGIAMNEYAEEHERGDFLIRAVGGVHPDRGSVVVGDEIEVGRTVRFQVRDSETAHADLAQMLAEFSVAVGPTAGALIFSCNGRGASMFGAADHDAQLLATGLDGAPAVAGFFAGGEIGPVGGRNHLHGFTASILTFSAAAKDDDSWPDVDEP